MQPVTEALKNSLNRSNPVYGKTVELYRLVWNGSAYVFDTPIDITNQIKDAGKIMWKFDKEDFNVWNLANLTLTIRNDRQQWKQDNPKGLFPDGHLIRGSKVIIKAGAQLADGTFEEPYAFTGFINSDPIASTDNKTTVVTIFGSISVFSRFNAEAISNPISNEEHAYSAPGQVDFTTTNTGVAAVGFTVKRGLTASGPGGADFIYPTTGYSISNDNRKNIPITVSLVSALTASESLWFTYKYWYTDKTYEWLVEQVMLLCGVASYSITPAVFSSSALNTWNFNTQADWETCDLLNVDTKINPGSFDLGLIDSFNSGSYSISPVWTVRSGSWSASTGELRNTGGNSVITTPFAQAVGTWEFKGRLTGTRYSNTIDFRFLDSSASLGGSGYSLTIFKDNISSGTLIYRLYKNPTSTLLGSYSAAIDSSQHTVRISRDVSGNMSVYIDGTLRITATDNTYTSTVAIGFTSYPYEYPNTSKYNSMDDVYYWNGTVTSGAGVLTSPIRDTGGSLTSWGKLITTYTGNGGSVLIETYSAGSSDFSTDLDPAGWISIDGTGQILSALKRYIKFRVTATVGPIYSPVFDEISLLYYTSTTVIDLVNLTGMNCDSVLDTCAVHPCYEYGFNSSNVFIYRPRNTSIPSVIDLRSDTNVVRLLNIVNGVDRVKNRVVANFGIYSVTADSEGDASPNSKDKYGDIVYPVPGSSLLPADNVNIAYAIAPTILAYTKLPRRRCQAVCRSLPYLELGDKIILYFNEPTAFRQWKLGDTDVVYGDPSLEYYDEEDIPPRVSFWGVTMRIEGIEFDWWGASKENGWQMVLDLVEVL